MAGSYFDSGIGGLPSRTGAAFALTWFFLPTRKTF
jgi:hypothetical protein